MESCITIRINLVDYSRLVLQQPFQILELMWLGGRPR